MSVTPLKNSAAWDADEAGLAGIGDGSSSSCRAKALGADMGSDGLCSAPRAEDGTEDAFLLLKVALLPVLCCHPNSLHTEETRMSTGGTLPCPISCAWSHRFASRFALRGAAPRNPLTLQL
jgi:hypothetical protein